MRDLGEQGGLRVVPQLQDVHQHQLQQAGAGGSREAGGREAWKAGAWGVIAKAAQEQRWSSSTGQSSRVCHWPPPAHVCQLHHLALRTRSQPGCPQPCASPRWRGTPPRTAAPAPAPASCRQTRGSWRRRRRPAPTKSGRRAHRWHTARWTAPARPPARCRQGRGGAAGTRLSSSGRLPARHHANLTVRLQRCSTAPAARPHSQQREQQQGRHSVRPCPALLRTQRTGTWCPGCSGGRLPRWPGRPAAAASHRP